MKTLNETIRAKFKARFCESKYRHLRPKTLSDFLLVECELDENDATNVYNYLFHDGVLVHQEENLIFNSAAKKPPTSNASLDADSIGNIPQTKSGELFFNLAHPRR